MLTFVTFKWGSVYSAYQVNQLARQIRWGLRGEPHRFICVTDDPTDLEVAAYPLWDDCSELISPRGAEFPSCYRRFKLFDPETIRSLGCAPGSRVIAIDLDVLVTDDLRPLFVDRPEPFLALIAPGTRHQTTYNGSLWMWNAGENEFLWKDFNHVVDAKAAMTACYFGSDQAILSHKMIGVRGYKAGWTQADGVYAFRDIRGQAKPPGVRLVAFFGRYKPWDPESARQTPWIEPFWTGEVREG
jgi:hypothetical protein